MPKIVIKTDGTEAGTTLTVDGAVVANLDNFYLSAYFNQKDCCCPCTPVSFSYSTKEKSKDESMTKFTTFRLDPAKASLIQEEGKPQPTIHDFKNM